jgi:Predicted membrane protein (DUF2079)
VDPPGPAAAPLRHDRPGGRLRPESAGGLEHRPGPGRHPVRADPRRARRSGKLWPSPIVLLIFSSAGLAATAPAAYLFYRALLPQDRRESAWLAVALAAPIPFWYAIHEATLDFFRPQNMALPFALLAAWAGLRGGRVLMWTLCLLTLACNEGQTYTVIVIALLMRTYGAPEVRKHWRLILYVAVFYLAVSWLRAGAYSDIALRPETVLVMATIFASLAAMPMFAPRWLLLVLPPYLANALSGHYVLLLLFPFLVAAAVGAKTYLQARSLKPAWVPVAMVPPLVLGLALGHVPPALRADTSLYSRPNAVAELQTATAMIPAGAPVNADGGLAVWLANRHTINDFPDHLDGNSYVVIDREAFISPPTQPVDRNPALDALPTSGRTLLYDDGRFVVWSPVGGD